MLLLSEASAFSRQSRHSSTLADISDVLLHGERVEVETVVGDAHRNDSLADIHAAVSCGDAVTTAREEGLLRPVNVA